MLLDKLDSVHMLLHIFLNLHGISWLPNSNYLEEFFNEFPSPTPFQLGVKLTIDCESPLVDATLFFH